MYCKHCVRKGKTGEHGCPAKKTITSFSRICKKFQLDTSKLTQKICDKASEISRLSDSQKMLLITLLGQSIQMKKQSGLRFGSVIEYNRVIDGKEVNKNAMLVSAPRHEDYVICVAYENEKVMPITLVKQDALDERDEKLKKLWCALKRACEFSDDKQKLKNIRRVVKVLGRPGIERAVKIQKIRIRLHPTLSKVPNQLLKFL